MTLDSFEIGGNTIRIVKQHQQKSVPEKLNSWADNSIPIRHTYSPVRVKRQTKEEIGEKIPLQPAMEVTKSSQQIQFMPTLASFPGPPETINSYPMTSEQLFAPTNYIQSGYDASFVPMFLQFQQHQTPPVMQLPHGFNAPAMQPVCFLSQGDLPPPLANNPLPLYCTYIPAKPTYQFPVVPGISDFDHAVLASSKDHGDQADFVRAQYSNPYEHLFREYLRDCPANFYRCADGTKCISKLRWCDNYVNCADASDETKCSCRERIDRVRLCDNYHDCPHGEDELGCFGCPKDSFSCNDSAGTLYNKSKCISQEERCDGESQCANGVDERDCCILTESYSNGIEMFSVGYSVGYLHKNFKGTWYPVCGMAYTWARDACITELGSISAEPVIELTTIPGSIGPYLMEDGYGVKLIPSCTNQRTYVRCPRVSSGTRFENTPRSRDNSYLEDNSNSNEKNLTSDTTESSGPMVSIVGGHESSPRAWPFVVAINKNGHFHCGGAILNEWWVLSAAHCFNDYQQHYYEIDAGMLRRLSFSPTQQTRRLDGVIIHPSYDPTILKNDIALCVLSEPLYMNSWVRPARLPDPGSNDGFFGWRQEPMPGQLCVAVGWGAIAEGGADPDHLREVEVPIINCRHLEDKNRAEICAGVRQGGRDACQGDSGGPLLCRVSNVDPGWYVGGIVSHGIGCGRRNEPGAYTKVSHFVGWINSMMNSRRGLSAMNRPRTICPGFSCNRPHAKCLSARRRCDRIADCLEAEDEINCPFFSGRGLLQYLLGQQQEVSTIPVRPTSPTSVRVE